ncbi:POC1 centriolar protein homolog A-like [Bacillus rossius redtenbacheri]|uniref:POC1 centriolar protein homolog A-like n=1 Tax=Bacillus rossius redtenbacheri TaxID=93214 RepID=UPI002FDD25EA
MADAYAKKRTLVRRNYAREGQMLESLGNGYIFDGAITPATVIETNIFVMCVKYLHNFDLLAAGFFDGYVRLFSAKDAEPAGEIMDIQLRVNTAPVTSIKHGGSSGYVTNKFVATYGNGLVKCWNYESRKCEYTIIEKRETLGLEFHPSATRFATVGNNPLINIYSEDTHRLEQVHSPSPEPERLSGHSSNVLCVRFHPLDTNEFVTGGWDNTVHVWDLRQRSSVRHFSGVHMCGDAIDFSAAGSQLLTCAWQEEDPLQLWDYGSGRLIAALHPDVFSSKLFCGGYIHKDFVACGGTTDNLFRVVDLRNNSTYGVMRGMPKGVFCMDVGPPRPKRNSQPQLPRLAIGCGASILEIDYR